MPFLCKRVEIFHNSVKSTFVRFIIVGGLNSLFGYSVYSLMIWIGLSFIWATLVSQIMGILFNFITTGMLVFENTNKRLIVKFILSYVSIYCVNVGTNKVLQVLLDCNTYLSGVGAAAVSAICSFYILKTFVYKVNREIAEL